MNNKIIIIDDGIYTHRAIFALKFNPKIPATFTYLSMIMGTLYRIGVDPDDEILILGEGRNNWRKEFEKAYKENRPKQRQDSGIDFKYWYSEFNKLKEILNNGLNWHWISVDKLESDDLQSIACRFYKDKEVILCTYDKDMEQMFCYENVKIYSPITKKYKIKPKNFDLNRLQSEKIYKETTDNLISPILNETDYEVRKMCIDLINLPEWVEKVGLEVFQKISPKKDDINSIPFRSLQQRYANIYNDKSKVVDYNKQIEKENKKELREKTKKEKIKKAKQKEKQNGKITKNSEPAGCITA